jgi:hypothetical protein
MPGAASRSVRVSFTCVKCRRSAEAGVSGPAPQAVCGCGAATALATLALDDLVAIPVEDELEQDPMLALALDAIRARWRRGEAGLDEATDVIEGLSGLCGAPTAEVPLPPEWAADLFQFGLLKASGAVVNRYPGGRTELLVPTGDELNLGADAGMQAGMAAAVVAGGLLGAVIFRSLQKRGQDASIGGNPWIRIALFPVTGGCRWSVDLQTGPNQFQPITPEQSIELQAQIRPRMGPMARKFICFRAIFGCGLSSRMMNMLTAPPLARRLRELNPDIGPQADAMAQSFVAFAR